MKVRHDSYGLLVTSVMLVILMILVMKNNQSEAIYWILIILIINSIVYCIQFRGLEEYYLKNFQELSKVDYNFNGINSQLSSQSSLINMLIANELNDINYFDILEEVVDYSKLTKGSPVLAQLRKCVQVNKFTHFKESPEYNGVINLYTNCILLQDMENKDQLNLEILF